MEDFFKFKSVDCCQTHFSWIFILFFYFNFTVLLRVVKKRLLESHLEPSFMHFNPPFTKEYEK